MDSFHEDSFEKEILAEEIYLAATPLSSPSKPTTPPTTLKPPKDYEGLNGLKTQEFFGRGVGSRPVRILLTEEEIRQKQHAKLESDVNSALHFLNTKNRAKIKFFGPLLGVSRQDGWAGPTHEEMAFVFLWVCEDSRTSDLCLSSLFFCLSSLCLSCLCDTDLAEGASTQLKAQRAGLFDTEADGFSRSEFTRYYDYDQKLLSPGVRRDCSNVALRIP